MRREPQAQECFPAWLVAWMCFKFGNLAKGESYCQKKGLLNSV